jgi:hypothetical protein
MVDVLRFPGTKIYWESRRRWYSLNFQSEVDLLIADVRPPVRQTYEGGV